MFKAIYAFTFLFNYAVCDNFAVLVAGSNGWFNYRHQSDVAHSYQILRANGFPEENIVVMHYDDIANSPNNPFPGKIYNFVGGDDVYNGLPKHYTGAQVTPQNFLNVLAGKQTSPELKVLKTTKSDNIFVYFSDHGAPGIVAFPRTYLYADDLIKTLEQMYKEQKYNKLVFYLEACESGSMFNKLLRKDIRVYAHTAANPFQSSYASDYDSKLGTYLNDEWSRNWMYDTVSHRMEGRTLSDQYDSVKKATVNSNACLYGDLSMGKDALVQHLKRAFSVKAAANPESHSNFGAVSSRDVVLETLKRRIMSGNSNEELMKEYKRELESRKAADEFFANLNKNLVGFEHFPEYEDKEQCYSRSLTNFDCLRSTIDAYTQQFGLFTDYSLKYVGNLYELCSANTGLETKVIVDKINALAPHSKLLILQE